MPKIRFADVKEGQRFTAVVGADYERVLYEKVKPVYSKERKYLISNAVNVENGKNARFGAAAMVEVEERE